MLLHSGEGHHQVVPTRPDRGLGSRVISRLQLTGLWPPRRGRVPEGIKALRVNTVVFWVDLKLLNGAGKLRAVSGGASSMKMYIMY